MSSYFLTGLVLTLIGLYRDVVPVSSQPCRFFLLQGIIGVAPQFEYYGFYYCHFRNQFVVGRDLC